MDAPLALTRPKRAAASVALPDPSPDVAAKRRCEHGPRRRESKVRHC